MQALPIHDLILISEFISLIFEALDLHKISDFAGYITSKKPLS